MVIQFNKYVKTKKKKKKICDVYEDKKKFFS